MKQIHMLSIRLHPKGDKLAHFKTIENAYKWLNLSEFDHFTVTAYFTNGTSKKTQLKYANELHPWSKTL